MALFSLWIVYIFRVEFLYIFYELARYKSVKIIFAFYNINVIFNITSHALTFLINLLVILHQD